MADWDTDPVRRILPQGDVTASDQHDDAGCEPAEPDVTDLRQVRRGVKMQRLDAVDAASLRDDIPAFRAGDTVKVHVKVIEGNRSRIQVFQGVVLARRGHGVSSTFTVRKISFGVGVERTFPLHAPTIDRLEVITKGDVRRAKLYYLRNRHGKAAKIKEHRSGSAE